MDACGIGSRPEDQSNRHPRRVQSGAPLCRAHEGAGAGARDRRRVERGNGLAGAAARSVSSHPAYRLDVWNTIHQSFSDFCEAAHVMQDRETFPGLPEALLRAMCGPGITPSVTKPYYRPDAYSPPHACSAYGAPPRSTLHKNDASDHAPEEIPRPYGERFGVFHEGLHLASCLAYIQPLNSCFCDRMQLFRA